MLTPQLEILLALFIIGVIVWMILLVYKSRLERQEEDKVFLGSTERLKEEDAALLQKVNRLSKPIWIVAILTVLFLLAGIGVWIYQGLISG